MIFFLGLANIVIREENFRFPKAHRLPCDIIKGLRRFMDIFTRFSIGFEAKDEIISMHLIRNLTLTCNEGFI